LSTSESFASSFVSTTSPSSAKDKSETSRLYHACSISIEPLSKSWINLLATKSSSASARMIRPPVFGGFMSLTMGRTNTWKSGERDWDLETLRRLGRSNAQAI
jgi:hypothetical protein